MGWIKRLCNYFNKMGKTEDIIWKTNPNGMDFTKAKEVAMAGFSVRHLEWPVNQCVRNENGRLILHKPDGRTCPFIPTQAEEFGGMVWQHCVCSCEV